MVHLLESPKIIREMRPDKLSDFFVIDEVVFIFRIELYPGIHPISHFGRHCVSLHCLPDRLRDSLSIDRRGSGRQESRDCIQCGHFLAGCSPPSRLSERIVNLFCSMVHQMAIQHQLLTLPTDLVDLFPILWIQCFFDTKFQVVGTDGEVMYAIAESDTSKSILQPFLSEQESPTCRDFKKFF